MRKPRPGYVVAVFGLLALLLGALLLFSPGESLEAARIEAVKGKQYRMSKKHGPWMIMVANFRDIPKTRIKVKNGRAFRVQNKRYTPGLSAQEAAQQLVYELRRKGIPAYVFSQADVPKQAGRERRSGLQGTAGLLAEEGSLCVMAGNYSSNDDKVAQRTLKYVKRFQPKLLSSVEKQKAVGGTLIQKLRTGGVLRRTPGRPKPLSGAFLTINPLLTPEEAAKRRRDPLLLKLNAGGKYSLLDNPGRFTLIVATSYVESKTTKSSRQFQKALLDFRVSQHLDATMMGAWQLTKTLREGRVPIRTGNLGTIQRNFEAYVFHDRYGSFVTVGSFDSPHDPRIAELRKLFGAKIRKNPLTGRDVLIAEVVTLPDPANNGASLRSWIFDPNPRLMEVPKLR